jgi:hypothetical protein
VPPGEGDGEPAGIVHANHAGVAAFVLKERGHEADGGTGG